MLYSIGVAVLAYYAFMAFLGLLLNAATIEGSLISLAVIALIGGYLARSRYAVRRFAYWIGGVSLALVGFTWVVLPVLQVNSNFWVKILALVSGLACYIASRRHWFRRYLTRDVRTRMRPAPPLGSELFRWVVLILA